MSLSELNAKLRHKLPIQVRLALAIFAIGLLLLPIIFSCIPESRIPFKLDEVKQAERKAVIEKMIAKGISLRC